MMFANCEKEWDRFVMFANFKYTCTVSEKRTARLRNPEGTWGEERVLSTGVSIALLRRSLNN